MDCISKQANWKGLQNIISIETKRITLSTLQTQTEQRFYISSILKTPKEFNEIIRGNWSIENNLTTLTQFY